MKKKAMPIKDLRIMTLDMVDLFLADAVKEQAGTQFLYALQTRVNLAVEAFEEYVGSVCAAESLKKGLKEPEQGLLTFQEDTNENSSL